MTSGISKALRNIVAERDSYTCILCTNPYSDIHHVTPRAQGGRDNPHNLVSLCRPCHAILHREIPLPQSWRKLGYEDRAEWIAEMEQRMIEYTHDCYARDIERGTFIEIDHDRFKIYGVDPIDWKSLNESQKRNFGQMWDKDLHKWVDVIER